MMDQTINSAATYTASNLPTDSAGEGEGEGRGREEGEPAKMSQGFEYLHRKSAN